jgi:hypothetical protein
VFFYVYQPFVKTISISYIHLKEYKLIIIIQFIFLLCFFIISIINRKWLSKLISELYSGYLDYNDLNSLMSFFEDVVNNEKNVFENIELNWNVFNLILLGLSNTLSIILLIVFSDTLIEIYLGTSILENTGMLFGGMLVTLSILLYIYFEIQPLEEIEQRQESKPDDLTSIFFKKMYDNNTQQHDSIYQNIASIVTLFFVIPKINIKKHRTWIGVYLCSNQLKDLIMELKNKETSKTVIDTNFTDFFSCDDIKGLEDLSNIDNLLPLDFLKRMQGNIGENHPKPMKGLTIKFHHSNDEGKVKHPYLSFTVVPWKGRKITTKVEKKSPRQQKHPANIDDQSKYLANITIKDHRLFTIYVMGESDSVESLKHQFNFRAKEAKKENMSFITIR